MWLPLCIPAAAPFPLLNNELSPLSVHAAPPHSAHSLARSTGPFSCDGAVVPSHLPRSFIPHEKYKYLRCLLAPRPLVNVFSKVTHAVWSQRALGRTVPWDLNESPTFTLYFYWWKLHSEKQKPDTKCTRYRNKNSASMNYYSNCNYLNTTEISVSIS